VVRQRARLSDFAVVTIEHGVGMGFVMNHRIYRGAQRLGMELGHTKVQLDGALCRCGQRGCLEAYIADYALAREATTALNWVHKDGQPINVLLESLYDHAKAGNATARSIFRRAGRYLAVGLSNVINLFDPALIILSGERMRYDYLYAAETLAEMDNLAINTGRPRPPIEIHAWGDLLWAHGAAALALSPACPGHRPCRPALPPGEPAESGLHQGRQPRAGIDGWRATQGHAKAGVTAGQAIVADHGRAELDVPVMRLHDPGPSPALWPADDRDGNGSDAAVAASWPSRACPRARCSAPQSWSAVAERLRRTGVFRSVALTEDDRILAPDLLPIDRHLVEEKRRADIRRRRRGVQFVRGRNAVGLLAAPQPSGRGRASAARRHGRPGHRRAGRVGLLSSRPRYTGPATLSSDHRLELGVDLSRLDEARFRQAGRSRPMPCCAPLSDRLSGRRAGLALRWRARCSTAPIGPARPLRHAGPPAWR
jgi:hypothetical protein